MLVLALRPATSHLRQQFDGVGERIDDVAKAGTRKGTNFAEQFDLVFKVAKAPFTQNGLERRPDTIVLFNIFGDGHPNNWEFLPLRDLRDVVEGVDEQALLSDFFDADAGGVPTLPKVVDGRDKIDGRRALRPRVKNDVMTKGCDTHGDNRHPGFDTFEFGGIVATRARRICKNNHIQTVITRVGWHCTIWTSNSNPST